MWYLFTVAAFDRSKYVTKQELETIYLNLRKRLRRCLFIKDASYEIGQYGGLHLHTLFKVKDSRQIRPYLYKYDGFNVDFSPIVKGTLSTVYNYIKKDARNQYVQEQIIVQNESMHTYMFN